MGVDPTVSRREIGSCQLPGEGPSRGLLSDCTTSPINRFAALGQIDQQMKCIDMEYQIIFTKTCSTNTNIRNNKQDVFFTL